MSNISLTNCYYSENNVVIDEDKLKDVFCKYEKKGINFEEFKKIFYSNSNYKNQKN